MYIYLLTIGQRPSAWVRAGYTEYATRMSGDIKLKLVEVAAVKRTRKADLRRIAQTEAERLLEATPTGSRIIALDERGKMLDTPELAQKMEQWQADGRNIALWVGGPEGLTHVARARAEWLWSLSPLTFPHPLVRVIVVEQLYRASSILRHHPYHRE